MLLVLSSGSPAPSGTMRMRAGSPLRAAPNVERHDILREGQGRDGCRIPVVEVPRAPRRAPTRTAEEARISDDVSGNSVDARLLESVRKVPPWVRWRIQQLVRDRWIPRAVEDQVAFENARADCSIGKEEGRKAIVWPKMMKRRPHS